ncbi:hypothetical protein ACIG56_34630 [Nocardia fusca]|uniref:hypothetical protein n=1 Tax=Nocardia fusca TaxID=941183 RepID=UPI0037CAD658
MLRPTTPAEAAVVGTPIGPLRPTPSTETTLIGTVSGLLGRTPTEPAVVRTAPAVRTPGAAIVPASIRVTE